MHKSISTEQTSANIARVTGLLAEGYQVVRFTNMEVERNLEVVLENIFILCKR